MKKFIFILFALIPWIAESQIINLSPDSTRYNLTVLAAVTAESEPEPDSLITFTMTGVNYDSVRMQTLGYDGTRFVVGYSRSGFPADTTNKLFAYFPADTASYTDTTTLFNVEGDSIFYFTMFSYDADGNSTNQDTALINNNDVAYAGLGDYFVEPLTGNNANSGTHPDTAWQTLAYAVANATTSGDTIILLPGTHNVSDTLQLAVGVSLGGIDSLQSIILSSETDAEWDATLILRSADSTDGNQSVYNVWFDGNDTASIAIAVAGRNNVKIHNCQFTGWEYYGVYFDSYQGYGIHTSADPPSTYVSGNSFYNNRMYDCSAYHGTYARGSIAAGGQDSFYMYNNNIEVILRTGQTYPGYGYKNYSWGHNRNSKFYDNAITLPRDPDGEWNMAMEFWHIKGGVEVYNNTIVGSIDLAGNGNNDPTKAGSQKGSYSYSAWIHDNTIGPEILGSTDEVGVYVEASSEDVLIERNWIRNVRDGVQFSTNPSWTDSINRVTIRYNVFDSIGATSASKGYGVRFTGAAANGVVVQDLKIYNNVIKGDGSGTIVGINYPQVGSATGFNASNNIITGFDYAAFYADLGGSATITNPVVENNILYDNAADTILANGNTIGITWAGNLSSDPLYVSATDYHLQNTSPGLLTGKDLSLTLDYDSVEIYSTPNIGAYESLVVISAEIGTYDDSIFVVKMNHDPNSDSIPLTSDFTITEGVSAFGVNAVTMSNDTTFIAMDSTAVADSTYLIDYTSGVPAWQDAQGNEVATFTDSSVTNNVVAGGGNCGSGSSEYGMTTKSAAFSTCLADYIYYDSTTVVLCGQVDTAYVYVGATATANSKIAIYDDNAGSPGNLLGTSTEISHAANQYNAYPFSTKPDVNSGQKIWIAYHADATDNVSDSGAPTVHYESQAYASGFPASASSDGTVTRVMGFYIVVDHEVPD